MNGITGSFRREGSTQITGRLAVLGFVLCGATGALSSLVLSPDVKGAFGAALAVLTAGIAFHDWRAFRIPDGYSGSAFVLGLLSQFVSSDGGAVAAEAETLLRGGTLALAFLVIRIGYRGLRRREGLGIGDIKLAAVAGVWLDWASMVFAVEAAALSALAFLLARSIATREALHRELRLPFGLFFAPAIWLGWFLGTLASAQA